MTKEKSETETDQKAAEPRSWKIWLVFGLGCTIVMVLLRDLLRLDRGGGITSVIGAFQAVNARAPSVDIDGEGFQSVGIALAMAVIVPLLILMRVDANRRLHMTLAAIGTVVLGFSLAAVLNEFSVPAYMNARGYSRCAKGDHHVGKRKSSVWFDNYVSSPNNCHPPRTAKG